MLHFDRRAHLVNGNGMQHELQRLGVVLRVLRACVQGVFAPYASADDDFRLPSVDWELV